MGGPGTQAKYTRKVKWGEAVPASMSPELASDVDVYGVLSQVAAVAAPSAPASLRPRPPVRLGHSPRTHAGSASAPADARSTCSTRITRATHTTREEG